MSLSVVARSQAAATFRGTITSGSGPVSGVDVWILGPDQHVQTDSSGAFTLAETAMGHQIVQLRRVGYATQRDTLTFAPGIEIRRAYTLTPVTNTLRFTRSHDRREAALPLPAVASVRRSTHLALGRPLRERQRVPCERSQHVDEYFTQPTARRDAQPEQCNRLDWRVVTGRDARGRRRLRNAVAVDKGAMR